ncbi:MAG TPA: helix-turn-helix domain-containing protein [Lacipirellulaceae bacterium]|nr:helix-turn-helix domain-containing protein [Lacipirellulaceae bacterium]HMP06570.1 helix-turn-helix domain-containing protein [Lacipirellulaceae bacterium]
MVNLKQYIQIAEAAQRLGVSQNTLRNWVDAGKIRAYRNPTNGYRLFRPVDLDRFLRKVSQPISPPRRKPR